MSSEEPFPHDPFAPPTEPVEVFCLHCGNVYISSEMRFVPSPQGACEHQGAMGDWMCPAPGCDGIGFQFDIHPTDTFGDGDDEDDDDGLDEDEFAEEAFTDFISDSQEEDIFLPAQSDNPEEAFAGIAGEVDWLESRHYPYARRWQMWFHFPNWTQDSSPDASHPGRGDFDKFNEDDIPF